jgi:hypothetical protein
MSDDITRGGMLPLDDTLTEETEFDPDGVESDDMLDDIIDDELLGDDIVDDDDTPLFDPPDE